MPLKVTVLGSGTSTGVPMIGCRCPACTSSDPRDRRFRSSILIEAKTGTLVIDLTPDFYPQMLRSGIERIDGVLVTHAHADHIHGIDDLRHFTFRMDRPMPMWCSPETAEEIRRRFYYIWTPLQQGGGLVSLDLTPVAGPFEAAGQWVVPIPVWHGALEIYGYRIGPLAYVSDVSRIPEASMELLKGVDTLFIDAVRHLPHDTHFNVEQALEHAQRCGARQTWLTHISHHIVHAELERQLPPGVGIAWDGAVFEVRERKSDS